jgi:hypothetical protein
MIKAQITVYASLTFAIVISFICTMINSVRMSVIYYETDMATLEEIVVFLSKGQEE